MVALARLGARAFSHVDGGIGHAAQRANVFGMQGRYLESRAGDDIVGQR
jgi:hypothetical protein